MEKLFGTGISFIGGMHNKKIMPLLSLNELTVTKITSDLEFKIYVEGE